MGICIILHTEKNRSFRQLVSRTAMTIQPPKPKFFIVYFFSIRRKIDSGFMPEFIFYVYGGRNYV